MRILNMAIPREFIEKILFETDITDVVSDYLTLKRAGNNYKALCPFHNEKTPSFVVSREKGIFHCFGCGAGGNALTFVKDMEKCSFVEAVKIVSSKLGYKLPRSADEGESREIYYEIMSAASSFYFEALKKNKKVLSYLSNRKISDEAVKNHKLGYAPGSFALYNHLKNKFKGAEEKMVQLGLIKKSARGYYDYFKDRLMFPVEDIYSRTVAFGGRILNDSAYGPKYLNSPDTPIFKKSYVLYGLNYAKESLRKENKLILVEGYIDVIMLHQAGIKNAAATLGTALNESHSRLIKRYIDTVYFCYDGDSSGKNAMLRGISVLLSDAVNVKVIEIPGGLDPADYIIKQGAKGFLDLVNAAADFFSYYLNTLREIHGVSSISAKKKIIEDCFEIILKVSDPIVQNDLLRSLSDFVNIDEKTIRMNLKTKGKVSAVKETAEEPRDKAEKEILKCITHYPDYFTVKVLSEINRQIKNTYITQIIDYLIDSGMNFETLNLNLTDEALKIYTQIKIKDFSVEDIEKYIEHCFYSLKKFDLEDQLSIITKLIKEEKDFSEQQRLLCKKMEIKKEFGGISAKIKNF